jgi:hypothetical protein
MCIIVVFSVITFFLNVCVHFFSFFFSGNLALCVAVNNLRDTEWRNVKKKSSSNRSPTGIFPSVLSSESNIPNIFVLRKSEP